MVSFTTRAKIISKTLARHRPMSYGYTNWLTKIQSPKHGLCMKVTKNTVKYLILLALCCLPLVSCAQSNGNKYPLDKAYLHHRDLAVELSRIDRKGDDLVRLHLVGFSGTELLPIQALEIGSRKATRNVLIIGQHHGDEVLGVEVAMAFAELLVSDYAKNRRIQAILDEFRFWIVPTKNPEGYRIVSSGEYPWKRKNNRDTNKNSKFDLRTDGVDLNRNYPLFWEHDLTIQPESPYFKGFAPATESETIAIMKLADRVRFEFAIFYHSSATGAYSEKIYLPWFNPGDDDQRAALEEIRAAAELYAAHLPKDYDKGTYEVHTGYNSRVGNARNYFFHTHGTKAFLVEIGGINRFGISVIHPSAKVMKQNVKKHLNALITLFYNYLD